MQKSRSNALEDNFREILDLVSDSILIVSPEGVILEANKSACNVLLTGVDGLVGKNFKDLPVMDDKTKLLIANQLKDRLNCKPIAHYEIAVIVDGKTKYLEPKGNRIDYFGQPADLIVLRDVTEKRHAHGQLLAEAEKRYQALFEQSPIGVVLIDPENGAAIEFNEAACKQLGYEPEEYRKLTLYDVSTASPQDIRERIKEILVSGKAQFESKHKSKNGDIKNVNINTTAVELSGKKYLLSTNLDVTDVRKAHDQLQISEKKFHGMAYSVRDATVLVDEEAKVTYWNPGAEKTFGYTSQEAIGKNIHELVVPDKMCRDGKERISDSVKLFSETGAGYFTVGNVELIGKRKDGTEFPAELSLSPINLCGKWNAVGLVKDITNRKESEQKLREAEQLYHTLFNESPLGVVVVDPKTGEFMEFNDTTHNQLAYSREEFRKLTVYDIEAKESAEETKAHLAEMMKLGGGEFETRHHTKNGEVRYVLVTTRTSELANRRLLMGIFHDITETKNVQNALMQSEVRYRQLVELAQEGIWAFDNDYTTIFVNPKMSRMLGFSQSEMLGKSLWDFLDKKIVEATKHYLNQHPITQGQTFSWSLPCKDGKSIDIVIQASPITDDEGKITGTLALISDVTEEKRMQASLKRERDMLEDITRNIGAGLVIVDKDYQILWANNFLTHLQGEVAGKACYSTLSALDSVCPGCGPKEIFEGAPFDSREYLNKTLEEKGLPCWFELITTPIKDADGNVVAALELTIDITERKKLQQKLSEYSQKLEELVQKRTDLLKKTQAELLKSERFIAIGELAGMIGHDLRNPLTGIKNSAYFLKKKGANITPAQSKEMLDTIDRCVDYSNKIVNDLLDYSREIRLEKKPSSLRALIDECIAMTGVPDKMEIANQVSDQIMLNVDSEKIKRVFLNLIKNGIEAMSNIGKLTIQSKEEGDKIELSFSDTGAGIPDEVLPKLFTPLFTTKAQGMGFGLAICKRIVEAHGGAIAVKTSSGFGTTFTVTLPLEKNTFTGGETIWMATPESLLSTTTKTLETP